MVSIQDWKTTECAQIDDSDHVEAIETLASLLEGDITPTDAAKMITKTYEASLKAIEGFWKDEHYHITKVHDFWSRYMTGTIRSFGSAEERERLFELLIEISRQPDLEDHDGMVMKSIDQKIFWSDLPGWNDPSDAGLFSKSIPLLTSSHSILLVNRTRQIINSLKNFLLKREDGF